MDEGRLYQTVVRLPVGLLDKIDQTRMTVRRTAGRKCVNSEIIRAALSAVFDAEIDFSECVSEADFRAAVAARLAPAAVPSPVTKGKKPTGKMEAA